ncbi:MAG: GNAT family N-acetyltransferase [Clostridia bacterium]|nr:GNAT family N-acetyltransferase [Clostridia bacterium]
MIDIRKLSSCYAVRYLKDSDVEDILDLCLGNPKFYMYTAAHHEREEIQNDMRMTPPGTDPTAKHYVGFFRERDLVAVMDLIDGYPSPETAYIGFFMMNPLYQGQGTGTAIISEAADYLREIGKTTIRLAIDKGNPQSSCFWEKNGFTVIAEADVNGWTKCIAERSLLIPE